MITHRFFPKNNEDFTILCLGAHSDDIEIGCGGSILRLLEDYPNATVFWIVLGSSGRRDGEAENSAGKFLSNAKSSQTIIKNFKDSFFPYIGSEIKSFFEDIKKSINPDIIFTHYRNDLHQDHRLVSELTLNTYRDHQILEYEIIKYDGDLGRPNYFFHLDKSICERKVNYLMSCFPSQSSKDWFSSDTFFAMLRLRGMEARAPSSYAEALNEKKIII